MAETFAVLGQHLSLTGRLFRRYGLVLTAIWAAGTLADQLLLRLAVELGMINRMLGLVAIAPVILLQLMIFVAFFVILRNGLPLMRLRRMREATARDAAPTEDSPAEAPRGFFLALMAVLVPFYGYYAGWGLLGDTMRSYSQIFYNAQMRRIDFTQPAQMAAALDVGRTAWVLLAVVVIWAIRRFAKSRPSGSFWAMLVIGCEATWALLGLYVISGWKDQIVVWIAHLPTVDEVFGWFLPAAKAAGVIAAASVRPVDWAPPLELWPEAVRLFWYALLPVVWFNLGAIVYGHNMNMMRDETRQVAGGLIDRWQALPRPVTDFVGHFWTGMIKRWHAVTNGVLLAASAGLALTVSVLVLWRLVDWLGNWAWIGAAHLIGPQNALIWQVAAVPLNALFNAPGAPAGGLLVSPLQFCILAAGLELAGRAQEAARAAPIAAAGSAEA